MGDFLIKSEGAVSSELPARGLAVLALACVTLGFVLSKMGLEAPLAWGAAIGICVVLLIAGGLFLSKLSSKKSSGKLIERDARMKTSLCAANKAEGIAKVRGTVRIEEPAGGMDGLAAYINPARNERKCGRFAIVDGTGEVIVDDEMFDLWDHKAKGPIAVYLRDGERAEVWGSGQRISDEQGERFVFNGTAEQPLQIIRLDPIV